MHAQGTHLLYGCNDIQPHLFCPQRFICIALQRLPKFKSTCSGLVPSTKSGPLQSPTYWHTLWVWITTYNLEIWKAMTPMSYLPIVVVDHGYFRLSPPTAIRQCSQMIKYTVTYNPLICKGCSNIKGGYWALSYC
jgi:hypothetical protein